MPREVSITKPAPKGKDKIRTPSKSTAFQPVSKTYTTIKKIPVSTKPKIIQKSEEIGTKLRKSPVTAGDIKEDVSVVSESQQHSSSGKDNSTDGSLYVSALEDM